MIRHGTIPRVLILFFVMFAFAPALVASAQETGSDDSFTLHVNRPVTVAPDETFESLVVIDDVVTVEGLVTDTLVVINGDAVVNGEVTGGITVFGGTLDLGPEAAVGNVTLFRSEMTRADGATVTGDIANHATFIVGLSIFSVAFWIGTLIVTILSGFAFVALGGRYLARATETILHHPVETGVTGLATWVALPVVAVVAFLSLIGIPVGLVIVLVAMPLMGLLGYLVTAFLVGTWLAALANIQAGRYLAVIGGVIVLQLAGLVPWIGGLFVFVATLFGTGGLVYLVYRDRRERRAATTPVAPAGGAAHA